MPASPPAAQCAALSAQRAAHGCALLVRIFAGCVAAIRSCKAGRQAGLTAAGWADLEM